MNMKNEPHFINVCVACDDHFAPHAGALIASIVANKNTEDSPRFFILSDKLSERVKQQFREMTNQWNVHLSIVDCSDAMFQGLPTWRGKHNTYFRLAIHRLLPDDITKAFYLDCDMIATTSLAPLFDTDLSGKYAAVVSEGRDSVFTTHDSPYFNAGMILFNLEKYRDDNMEHKAIELGNRRLSEIEVVDQDLLNEVFAGNVVYASSAWNQEGWNPQDYCNLLAQSALDKEEMQAACFDHKIIHFKQPSGRPWRAFSKHPLRNLYWKYLRMTPFYQEVVKKYYISWVSALYQRYFRIRLSKKYVHLKLFGVDVILWKFSAKRVDQRGAEQ